MSCGATPHRGLMDWLDVTNFGPLAETSMLAEGHIPAPSDHSPRKEMLVHKDGTVTVIESENDTAWIRGTSTEVIQ